MVAVRLADLLAGLSRLADLGFGLQAGEALRSCALAGRLARSLELPDDHVRAACYTALLHVGSDRFGGVADRLVVPYKSPAGGAHMRFRVVAAAVIAASAIAPF